MSTDDVRSLVEGQGLIDQVLASITDFVYTFDLEGRFTFANRPLLELWGMELKDAFGKTFFELPYPKDLAEKLHQQIHQVINSGERLVDETRYDSPSGSVGYYEYIFSPVFGANGEVTAVAGSTRDISVSRQLIGSQLEAKMALEVERSNLTAAVREAPAFICILRGPNHFIEMANERYLDLIGRQEVVGMTIREALPEVEGQGYFELLDKTYATGEPAIGNEVPVLLGPEGAIERRFVNFAYQAMRDAEGAVCGVFIHGVDVTDLVVARKELEVSQDRLAKQSRLIEAISSNTPDLMYVWNLDHRFIYANDGLLAMWGKTREEAIGKNCLELGYEPWHAAMHDQEIDQVVKTRQPVRGEVPFTGAFGRRIYDYILVPVIGAHGEVEAVAGTTRDITDRVDLETKLAEQAELLAKESQMKDEFLAMLSHELRNPLAPISTAIEILKMDRATASPEKDNRALDILERQVKNLTKIVSDLLEISRVVSGRIHIDRQVVDLNKVIEHSVESVSHLIESHGHHVSITYCPRDLWMNVDPTRLEEVFVNLLNNAAKYTPDGGEIEVECECDDNGLSHVRVRDNGVGIDASLLPHVFDLFTQAGRSLDRAQGGLGIGLNLASRLVAMHGGTIEVSSPPPGRSTGSEFVVTLPDFLVGAPVEVQTGNENAALKPGGKVLVIDDNVDVVAMLSTYLVTEGFEVRSSHDGAEGLKSAQEWIPDVVVLDIGLPTLDGYEVARMLRQDPRTSAVRVIAVTGYGRDTDIARAKESGIDAHLTKPYNLSQLTKLFVSADCHEA